jgi:predicted metal-dependent hydrolase
VSKPLAQQKDREETWPVSTHILAGNPPVEVHLRRSARARRISLRVSSLDGKVTLTLPAGVRDAEALDFAQDRADWIRKHLVNVPSEAAIVPGAHVPIEGIPRRIVAGRGRRVVLSETEIAVPGDAAALPKRLAAFLKTLARDRLVAASDEYADRLGRPFERISLRDTRSRWGSCSTRGTLMYSWRLILAPGDVLRYVAAHEVAHLEEMNHSPRFWAAVERIHGPYHAPRRWLRENGRDLHRYSFGA